MGFVKLGVQWAERDICIEKYTQWVLWSNIQKFRNIFHANFEVTSYFLRLIWNFLAPFEPNYITPHYYYAILKSSCALACFDFDLTILYANYPKKRNVYADCETNPDTPPRPSEISEKNWSTKTKSFLTSHLWYKAILKIWNKILGAL